MAEGAPGLRPVGGGGVDVVSLYVNSVYAPAPACPPTVQEQPRGTPRNHGTMMLSWPPWPERRGSPVWRSRHSSSVASMRTTSAPGRAPCSPCCASARDATTHAVLGNPLPARAAMAASRTAKTNGRNSWRALSEQYSEGCWSGGIQSRAAQRRSSSITASPACPVSLNHVAPPSGGSIPASRSQPPPRKGCSL
jgi:hypothetical protein